MESLSAFGEAVFEEGSIGSGSLEGRADLGADVPLCAGVWEIGYGAEEGAVEVEGFFDAIVDEGRHGEREARRFVYGDNGLGEICLGDQPASLSATQANVKLQCIIVVFSLYSCAPTLHIFS
jgi:hypothetical protein